MKSQETQVDSLSLANPLRVFEAGMDRKLSPWYKSQSGTMVNLGCGNKHIDGAHNLDYPDWDYHDGIPFNAGSVREIYAFHFMEHVDEPVKLLLEALRVLCPGGVMNMVTPYYTSQMQAHDLDHKTQYCEETWRVLFSTPYYDKNQIEWKFEIGFNMIMGIVERNLCLVTQLIRTQ